MKKSTLVIAVVFLNSTPVLAERPYTAEDMLMVEEIGNVLFTPDGDKLIFERYGPRKDQSDHGFPYVRGEMRSKIFVVDLENRVAPQHLFPQSTSNGYTIAGLSPDGTHLAFGRLSQNGYQGGIASLNQKSALTIEESAVYAPQFGSSWIDDGELALRLLRPGEVSVPVGVGKERFQRLARLWKESDEGNVVTIGRIGSGQSENERLRSGKLMVVDARSGGRRVIAERLYGRIFDSPNGGFFAGLLDKLQATPLADRIKNGFRGGRDQRLLVINIDRPAWEIEPCADCAVDPDSVVWDDSGSRLAFIAKDVGRQWSDGHLCVFDTRTGQTMRTELRKLGLKMRPLDSTAGASVAWIEDQVAILAGDLRVASDQSNRTDWYQIIDGQAEKLTGSFVGEAPSYIGSAIGSLIFLYGGDLWNVTPKASPRNLTASISSDVDVWVSSADLYGARSARGIASERYITLQTKLGDDVDRLYFFNLDSADFSELAIPIGTTVLATSPRTKRAAVLDRSGADTKLLVIEGDKSIQSVLQLNKHLLDVAGGKPVKLDHILADGSLGSSWMLLPPDFQSGHPVPTIVSVYPGRVGGPRYLEDQLDDASTLNMHILASQGYAILFPSIPMKLEAPRDTMADVRFNVDAAIDAAISAGFSDSDMFGIHGQSFGAYATASIIGNSRRFKAAVVQAGFFNLTSMFGQFDIRQQFDFEDDGLNFFPGGLTESPYIGMGSPPWVDSERYLRNSPLFSVDKVSIPVLLTTGDQDYVSTTQTEEYFSALYRLNKNALMLRYYGEEHVLNSPANVISMWSEISTWYSKHVIKADSGESPAE